MNLTKQWALAMAAVAVCSSFAAVAFSATTSYVGTEYDIGGNYYPGDGPANVSPFFVVPWRSNSTTKLYDADGNNVYGSAGYYLFGTWFDYPDRNAIGGSTYINPADTSMCHNLTSAPAFVAGSHILATRKTSGWNYSIIDDPTLTNGTRDTNWGLSQTPAAVNQAPYVKLGFLDGGDVFGNNLTSTTGVARWGFQVGANAPATFRVGVMTDGGDNAAFAPNEMLLAQVVGNAPVSLITSGTVTTSRYGVDMHFFDISGAAAGDQFVFFVKNSQSYNWGNAGVAGFSFDVVPEPCTLLLLGLLGAAGLVRRSSNH